jgi:hypothetical protein
MRLAPFFPMRLAPLFALSLLLAAGCSPTRIPPPPERLDAVVLTSNLAATALYADALAAFLRNNWEPLTGDGGSDDLSMRILPDGERVEGGGPTLVLHVAVRPVNAPDEEPIPDLADADYAGPDLSRRDLSDPARGQNEPDSLRRRVLPDSLTTGSAVLTATIDASLPGARAVLIRTARILASVQGDLSYR